MTARIVPARGRDAPALARLCRDEVEMGLGWRWRPGAIARLIARPEVEVALALLGEERVGFGVMELGPEDAELLLFAIDPRHRRQGVGTALLRYLETEAAQAGLRNVWLHVRADNVAALEFYERSGYRVDGFLRAHYAGREDALRLVHALTQAEAEPVELPDLASLLRGGP